MTASRLRSAFLLALACLFALSSLVSAAGWSNGAAISPVGAPDPTRGDPQQDAVALGPGGLAIAAWDQYWYTGSGGSSIGVNVQPAGSKWNTPVTLSDPGLFATHPRVAVGGDGSAFVIWTADGAASRQIQVAMRPAGSATWTQPANLATGVRGGVPNPGPAQIGASGRGDVVALWTIWDGSHNLVQAATRPAGAPSAWSAPVTLTAAGADGYAPALSVNAAGDAIAVWQLTPSPGVNAPNVIQAASLRGGAWTTAANISAVLPPLTTYYEDPQVAIDGSGLGVAVWKSVGSGMALWGTREAAGGAWAAPAALTPANALYSLSDAGVACDAAGNAMAIAAVFDSTINVDRAAAWVAWSPAGTAWPSAVRLTTAAQNATATRVAISPDGSVALAGWIDTMKGQVQVAQRGAAGWGAAANVGKVSAVASFAEYMARAAGSNAAARTVWKTQGGALHLASTYR